MPDGPFKQAPVDEGTDWVADYSLSDAFPAHYTVAPDGELPPRCAKRGIGSAAETPPVTLLGLFQSACAKSGDKVALQVERPCPPVEKKDDVVPWTKWTYKEMYSEAQKCAKACIASGMNQHDSIAIYGFNSPEWILAWWGGVFAGAKGCGIYPTDTPEQIIFKINHSVSRVVVTEKYNKIAERIEDMPGLQAIVVWGQDVKIEKNNEGYRVLAREDGSEVYVYTWREFLEMGSKEEDDELLARAKAMQPGHCCCIVYTSGTTGNPKGVMLSHDNLQYQASMVRKVMLSSIGNDLAEGRSLSYLPLSHVAGLLMDIVYPVAISESGRPHTVYCARPYDLKAGTLVDRLKVVKPTVFLGVPRVYEKIMEKMQAVGASIKGIKKMISTMLKGKSLAYAKNCQVGGSGSAPCCIGTAQKKLGVVREKLGLDCCKLLITGAAPMAAHVYEYFASIGMRIMEVYGMSESCGLSTANMPFCYLWGSVGYGIESVQVKVFKVSDTDLNDKKECPKAKDFAHPTEEEQGEICFRGRTVMMGYLSNAEMGDEEEIDRKTAECIDAEGWLHSGDKGTCGQHGMIKITGRYKELIIGSGGENVAPVPVEDNVKKLCPGISNVMMVGDKRKYNTMLVTLKCEGATGELPGTNQLTGPALAVGTATTIQEAMTDPAWKAAIDNAIKLTNENQNVCQNNAWKVQKWAILPRDFSVETDEFTATLKLKRSVACKIWNDEIEKLY